MLRLLAVLVFVTILFYNVSTESQCGTNQVIFPCANSPCLKTCGNRHLKIQCKFKVPAPGCTSGCICADGFYKNNNGDCVPAEQCPATKYTEKCTGEYEYLSCGPKTVNICDQSDEQNNGDVNAECNPQCLCLDGYERDANNVCVPIPKCPNTKCGENEVVSDCANSPCIKNCETKDLNLQCKPYPPGCKCGCVCADGFFRDCNDVCVPTEKCPPNKNATCFLKPETGPCRALIRRFYYNSAQDDCLSFDYGGCEGNSNNFETKKDCLKACQQ